MDTKYTGDIGELMATQYLLKNKYKILQKNYRTSIGEIDIIAKDGCLPETVFIEVKTRKSLINGLPRESVTVHKQNKIRQIALQYLKQNQLMDTPIRFDVIEIYSDNMIEHLKGIF